MIREKTVAKMKNNNVLTLYFADLTHDQILIANAMFPLGIGYVASALKAILKDEIELDLFKYPCNLDEALKKNPPDVYLFSSYMWNQNINLFYAKKVKDGCYNTSIMSADFDFDNLTFSEFFKVSEPPLPLTMSTFLSDNFPHSGIDKSS